MTTSIHSRAKRSRKYSDGAGCDPTAASYRSAREALRSAREFNAMLHVLQHVPGQKKRKAILIEGLMDTLKRAEYWRDHARHVRRQTKTRGSR